MTVTESDQDQGGPGVRPPGRRSRPTRRRGAPPGPAARFEPGRVAETRHRNPTWLIGGVLLVVLSALGGVLLFSARDDRIEVVVAATDLLPGEPLERADLRIARVAVGDDVAVVSPSAAGDLIGQQPVGLVPAGTLLSRGMFAGDVPLGAGEMVVGAALDPGEAPLSALQIGSSVELLAITGGAASSDSPPATDAGTPAPPGGVAAVELGVGTVWAVEQIGTGELWVSVRVPRDVGLAASLASAQDALRLVLVGGGG